MRDIPRLIIEHNIHGIDIDPRAVQIAGLSLWLRAQRSWQAQGLRPQARPTIRRSNIVCAEPMPGDKAQLDEFLKSLREDRLESLIRKVIHVPENQRITATPSMADALCELVSTVWHEMELAGEAGSLLKIEESLAAAIEHARNEWEQRLPLFRVETFRMTEAGEVQTKVNYPRSMPSREEADFWDRAETLVLAALEEYTTEAESWGGYQRRLFAQDAARGFVFIDLCKKLYDVVLMNPPFGETSATTELHQVHAYPNTKNDLYTASIERGTSLLSAKGGIGAITSRTGLFLTRTQWWRENIMLKAVSPFVVADLGQGVLDSAAVETACYASFKSGIGNTLFFKVDDVSNKELEIKSSVDAVTRGELTENSFWLNSRTFLMLPETKWLYWIPTAIHRTFTQFSSLKEMRYLACAGLQTNNDFRFVRLAWEVPRHEISRTRKWVRFYKGGEYSPYFDDIHLLVNWDRNGYEIKQHTVTLGNSPSRHVVNEQLYFHAGYGYINISSIGFSPQVLPKDVVFSIQGQFLGGIHHLPPFALIASSNVSILLDIINPGRHYQAGQVQLLPLPREHDSDETESCAQDYVNIKRSQCRWLEDSSLFVCPPYLGCSERLFHSYSRLWDELTEMRHQARLLQAKIDDAAFLAYQLDEDSIKYVENEIKQSQNHVGHFSVSSLSPFIRSEEEFRTWFVSSIFSYLIGVFFGRWDFRYAIGDMYSPKLPKPSDPLTLCPPGMLQNEDGLPADAADVPSDYPLRISWPGILVNDPGHPEDVVTRVSDALPIIWSDNADAVEQEACQILGVNSLRDYFANPNKFFDDHLKRYSKSRRYAPIYWPISTPSGSYTLWLYYHRINDQILYTCVNDFVDPKLAQVGEELEKLRRASNRSAAQEDEFGRLSDLARELKDFREELLRIAAFWRPNLNDGVQITAAPLWSLFQHRAWQKRLRDTWAQLEAGDYDWAHLCMSIWPARVVPKCVEDRSLAIAHEVEDLFWVEDDDSGWRPLQSPDAEVTVQKKRWSNRLSAKQRQRVLDALHELAAGSGRGVPAAQVAQYMREGHWDDTEVALLFWPERVAEQCLADPFLADRLRLNLPEKRTQSAIKRWTKTLVEAGVPNLADALLATLDLDLPFEQLVRQLEAGQRDELPLSLALWPERVIDQCQRDVHMAAGHGLRKYFWVNHPNGVWRRRLSPHREVTDEVARRG